MTANDILHKLRTEPQFLLDIIVFNNPEAVANKFKDIIAIQNDNPELLADQLTNFLNTGDITALEYCVKVPFITGINNPALEEAVEKLKAQYYGNTQTRVDMYSSGLYELITQSNTPKNVETQINTPAGNFTATVTDNKKKQTVYYVLGGAILVGILIYIYKNYK